MANLKFNRYIDDAGMVVDKQLFFNLPLKKFQLAPEFYWYQGQILDAIQADLEADRTKYYHMDSDTLADIAEEIVAGICFGRVRDEYLEDDGTINESQRGFFATPDNSATFALGRSFTPGFNQAVFAQLAAIQQWFDRYHVADKVFAALGLDANAIANLYALLLQKGFLDTDHVIPAEQHSYFSNSSNALTFSISGYDDYNRDIFFALQVVAKDMRQRRDEIVKALQGVAVNQDNAVLETLAQSFGIDRDSIRITCGYLFYNPPSLAEALLVPTLTRVGPDGRVTVLPSEYDFDRQLLRIAQFVRIVQKFQFGAGEVEVAFSDLNLVEKFPEDLVLPVGMTSFDALLKLDDKIYLFKGNSYWAYSSATYALVENAASLALLSRLFAGLDRIDAAFIDPMGNAWIISGTSYFIRKKGSTTWMPTERRLGLVANNFEQAGPINAAFTNLDGVSYLFSGDQFVRYSGESFATVDPGFPKKIQGNWPGEIGVDTLPERFSESIDAGFVSPNGQIILFKDDKFVRYDDLDPSAQERDIASFWGYVLNEFSDLTRLDAVFSDGRYVYLFLNDYVIRYEDQVENEQVMMSEGFPLRLANFMPGLPADFEYGIDAIFKGADDNVYVFKNNQYLVLSPTMDRVVSQGDLASKWGMVRNTIQTVGEIDAAFTGLDGYTYLFSGDQYFRYSGKDFTRVDEGFPRTIATDWGSLQSVTSAFILDGQTYLFAKGQAQYVRYSTHDYTTPDATFPKQFDQEEYWNLPVNLVTAGFTEPDAVFIGLDKATYLFKGNQFVAFDHLQRWWSEPRVLTSKWHDLEFENIDAAFTGPDGKTYLFSGKQFARYSDLTYSKMDARYPLNISTHWGLLTNTIAQSKRIDSAVVVDSHIMTVDVNGNQVETTVKHTYLFSGNQFFRYAGTDYTYVEEGYPLTMRTALQKPAHHFG